MKVLILNSILFTVDNKRMLVASSIKDTMIYGMCLGFKNLGNDVTLVAAEEYKPKNEEDYDFEVLFFSSFLKRFLPPSVLPYPLKLREYIKKEQNKFDLIISSEVFSFYSLFAAMICPQKTLIWQELTAHQNKFHQIPSKIWYKIIFPLFMKDIKTIVPRSEMAKEFIGKYSNHVSLFVVDHGVDVRKFICSLQKERQIISSSQLIYRKNVDGIINKFSRFTRMNGYEDIKLLIAGRGDQQDYLKELVSKLDLDDKVEFLGFLSQKELNMVVRKSLCFLVNTRKDLNMVSIPESIVSGTPILTNLQNSSAEYIRQNRLGIAKDNWDEYDIKGVIDDNKVYVQNCISYREKLTSEHSSALLIEAFKTVKQ
jgi:1,2-diacylglycerol 3-alpha-glucosyltransferase